MKALSILQPWAWLIVNGYKDIENRSWSTQQRGRVLVHAGKTYTRATHLWSEIDIQDNFGIKLPSFDALKAQTGGIVGDVEIIGCESFHRSRWKDLDSFGFVLANAAARPLIPYRGQLGFFDVDIETMRVDDDHTARLL